MSNWANYKNMMSRIYAMLLLCGMVALAHAQNNPQQILNRLYPLYVKAYNLRKSPQCLALADSLYWAAKAAKDPNGEIYALQVKFLHEYYKHDNLPAVDSSMDKFVDKALSYGVQSLYYYAVSLKVAYLTREKKYIEAFLYLDERVGKAKDKGDSLGVVSLYRMNGVIQQFRGELAPAVSSYMTAVNKYKENRLTRNISRELLSVSDCFRMMADYERMAQAAEDARQYCVSSMDRSNVAIYECYSYFMLGRYAEFLDRYEYLQTHKTKLDNSYIIMNKAVMVCKAIYDRRYDDARPLIDSVAQVSPEESYRLLAAYHASRNEYQQAIDNIRQLIRLRSAMQRDILACDKKSTDNIFRNQRLEAERQRIANANARLELENAQISLRNSSLELGRGRDAVKLARLAADRDSLSYNHQRLMSRQLRDSIAAQQIMQQAKQRRIRMERYVQWTVFAVALVAMLMTIVYTMRKRNITKMLKAANDSLGENIRLLNAAKEKAQVSERMKTLFIQNMSHEIRTPLNAIVGFSQLLTCSDNGLGSDEKKAMAGYIAENSDMLTMLVNDILDVTELESGNYSMQMERMNVNAVCRETIETVRYRLPEGVELRFNTGLDDLFTVVSDRHRIRQVLINMLTNAEKNTARGSITMECSTDEHRGMLTISVADTGIGVPKEKQADIFKRFKKLDPGKQGTGLGLDICRVIMQKLGGEINIDPKYTSGARFWITIPLAQ